MSNFTDMKEIETIQSGEVFDETDQSQLRQLHEIEMLTKDKKFKKETHPDFDGETCVVCGEDMPAQRLALGRIRCLKCQEKLEKKLKR